MSDVIRCPTSYWWALTLGWRMLWNVEDERGWFFRDEIPSREWCIWRNLVSDTPRGTFQSSWDQQVLRLERTVEARVDTHSLRTMTNYIWINPWKATRDTEQTDWNGGKSLPIWSFEFHIPSGKLTVCYWTRPFRLRWFTYYILSEMVINSYKFQSYVTLPEGFIIPYWILKYPKSLKSLKKTGTSSMIPELIINGNQTCHGFLCRCQRASPQLQALPDGSESHWRFALSMCIRSKLGMIDIRLTWVKHRETTHSKHLFDVQSQTHGHSFWCLSGSPAVSRITEPSPRLAWAGPPFGRTPHPRGVRREDLRAKSDLIAKPERLCDWIFDSLWLLVSSVIGCEMIGLLCLT